MLAYKAKKNDANALMNEARRKFYHNFIQDNSSSQRQLFSAAKKLLSNGDNRVVYPPVDDNIKLANQLGTFFIQKIETIGFNLDNMAQGLPTFPDDHAPVSPPPFSKFSPLTEEKVSKLINSSTKKSCTLDPMPTSLVTDCIDVLLPIITKMINLSLESGLFVDDWKCALVLPLLKKPGLDLLYKNYRPVSNLQYVSKLTEKMVFDQIHTHMMTHSLYPEFQSAYRKNHSTETALVRVTNDILMKMNTQEVTLLVMLDLSAAFDTVNHKILLTRLNKELGICGSALEWFKSYLAKRGQRVYIDGSLSERFSLKCGVPQGSCLGPLLFLIYTSKLFKVVEDQLPHVHCYADDTQFYLSFKPISNTSQEDAVRVMECCIEKIRRWLSHDRLLINDDKTEFIIIGTRQQLNKLQAMNIKVGSSEIKPSYQVKNLGSWLDPNLNMRHHITNMCKAGFFYLHNIRRIKKYLSRDSLLTLVHAFITSRLDYCNALLYGLPKEQIAKLQRVQNAAARLIMDIGKYSHITPALYELHWLPVLARIHFKILLLAFKAIHGLAPAYISNLLVIKRKSSYNIRSNSGILLEPPRGKMLATLGERAFQAAAPQLWNELPLQLRTIGSVEIFKNSIKTFLFKRFFNSE